MNLRKKIKIKIKKKGNEKKIERGQLKKKRKEKLQ
jgi:hypothetical protein